MIHNSSNSSVLVKKISLKIWTLRDEVEAIIAKRLEHEQDEQNTHLEELSDEYAGIPLTLENKVIPIKSAPPEENAQAEAKEEESQEPEASQEEGVNAAEAENPNQEAAEESPTEQVGASSDNSQKESDNLIVIQRKPILSPEKIFHGKTLLSEIYMDKIYFFSSKGFLEGQSIVLDFLIPKHFVANADVLYCRPYSMKSRIISENKMPFRVCAKFTFLKPGERTLLRQFIESIEPKIAEQAAKEMPKVAAGGDDTGFDELDDLGI